MNVFAWGDFQEWLDFVGQEFVGLVSIFPIAYLSSYFEPHSKWTMTVNGALRGFQTAKAGRAGVVPVRMSLEEEDGESQTTKTKTLVRTGWQRDWKFWNPPFLVVASVVTFLSARSLELV